MWAAELWNSIRGVKAVDGLTLDNGHSGWTFDLHALVRITL